MFQIAWEVQLDDGGIVRQLDGNLYQDLPIERIRKLRAIVEGFPIDVIVPDGCTPVYGVLHTKQLEFSSQVEKSHTACIVLGWRGNGKTSIFYMYPDGSIELSQRDFVDDD